MTPASAIALEKNSFPPCKPVVSDRNRIIQKIALQTLAEFAVSLGIGLVICLFVATPAGALIVGAAILVQNIVNLFARIVCFYATQKALEGGKRAEHFARIAQIASIFTPWSFAMGTALNASTLVHEAGHALAARAVYQNAHPQIEIHPFFSGLTRFNPETLSAFGRKLGENKSIALVAAAGPLLSLSVSSIALVSSLLMREKHPKISLYLRTAALSDFITHAVYAFTALYTPSSQLSHDFVRLSLCGIHPLAATAAIVATPILIALGTTALQRKFDERPQPQLALLTA